LVAFGVALLPAGCGGDSEQTPEGTGGKGGGKSMPEEGSGGAANGSGGAPTGSVPCGENNCTPPEGSTMTACCMDHFMGTCGVQNATGGCVAAPKPPPPGCPMIPAVMGFALNPCCTPAGQCGVDLTMLGQGCLDLAAAAQQAAMQGVMVGQVPMPTPCSP
jgi:hypothetical protein